MFGLDDALGKCHPSVDRRGVVSSAGFDQIGAEAAVKVFQAESHVSVGEFVLRGEDALELFFCLVAVGVLLAPFIVHSALKGLCCLAHLIG